MKLIDGFLNLLWSLYIVQAIAPVVLYILGVLFFMKPNPASSLLKQLWFAERSYTDWYAIGGGFHHWWFFHVIIFAVVCFAVTVVLELIRW